MIRELVLVEVFLELCSAKIFRNPMPPDGTWTRRKDFAFRRIIDVRLGLSLRHFGVEEFATKTGRGLRALGFRRVWSPLD